MASSLSYLLPFTPYPYRGESVACDLCGEREYEVVCEFDRRFKKLRTVACRRCGLLRTDPMPTVAEIEDYYANAYRWDYQFAREPSRRHLKRSRRGAKSRLELVSPALRPGARILDFGSGAGVFLDTAATAGYSVLGIEPGRDYANYARTAFKVEVINDVWENINPPPGVFDVITAVEVLEHLRRPVQALRWLASMLTENGVIYVAVPDLSPDDKPAFRRFHFAHLHGFTPTTLEWAARSCGLEIDPRYRTRRTRMVFRKSPPETRPPSFDRNQGDEISKLYPQRSVAWHLLSGAWIPGRFRQLRKTLRDTFAH
jgi:2-polyprenyl-3-methyl-5-hydroxy-6-metoxy-1,4-benzoquinol methylase